jgi:hypothetical protein
LAALAEATPIVRQGEEGGWILDIDTFGDGNEDVERSAPSGQNCRMKIFKPQHTMLR